MQNIVVRSVNTSQDIAHASEKAFFSKVKCMFRSVAVGLFHFTTGLMHLR